MQKEYKILINLILSVLIYFSAFTQANSWIDYNKQYFKIHVSSDGIYRITYNELLNAGVPVNLIDPRGIQLFYRGEEQYIYIKGESSTGIFDPAGYIEFYGIRNRGDDDLEFFDSPDSRVNNDYSFYNDTSVYFLTWSYSTGNRRFEVENDNNFVLYVPFGPDYCLRKIRTNYVSTYYWGSTRNLFTEGEGWFDNSVITETNPVTKTIAVPNFYSSSIPAIFEIAVAGVPANQVTSSVPHHLKVNFLGTEYWLNSGYNAFYFDLRNNPSVTYFLIFEAFDLPINIRIDYVRLTKTPRFEIFKSIVRRSNAGVELQRFTKTVNYAWNWGEMQRDVVLRFDKTFPTFVGEKISVELVVTAPTNSSGGSVRTTPNSITDFKTILTEDGGGGILPVDPDTFPIFEYKFEKAIKYSEFKEMKDNPAKSILFSKGSDNHIYGYRNDISYSRKTGICKFNLRSKSKINGDC